MSGITLDDLDAAVSAAFAAAGELVRTVELERESGGTYDPATGTRNPGSISRHSGRALRDGGRETGAKGGVQSPDGRVWLVRGLGVAPREGDRMIVGAESGRVVSAEDATAGGGRLWRLLVQ